MAIMKVANRKREKAMEKMRRIIALATVVCIVILVIATLVCGIAGSDYFFGVLFLTFVVPVILWVFMWFTNLVNSRKNQEEDEDVTEE